MELGVELGKGNLLSPSLGAKQNSQEPHTCHCTPLVPPRLLAGVVYWEEKQPQPKWGRVPPGWSGEEFKVSLFLSLFVIPSLPFSSWGSCGVGAADAAEDPLEALADGSTEPVCALGLEALLGSPEMDIGKKNRTPKQGKSVTEPAGAGERHGAGTGRTGEGETLGAWQ